MVEMASYDTLIRYRHWFESSYRNRLQSLEAHVDGHSAFNGGVAGSRPAGRTNTVYFDNVLYGAHKNRSRPASLA